MKGFVFEEESLANLSENDKKKNLFDAVTNTRIQAELSKIENEENNLHSRNIFKKLFEKLDGTTAFKEENISFKRYVINDKLNRNMLIKDNIDMNSVLADIELFLEDNKYNDLISDDIQQLNVINNYIHNNFDINSNEINNLITNRKQLFLPVLTRKLTKAEELKHETIKYLNKQGYNR